MEFLSSMFFGSSAPVEASQNTETVSTEKKPQDFSKQLEAILKKQQEEKTAQGASSFSRISTAKEGDSSAKEKAQLFSPVLNELKKRSQANETVQSDEEESLEDDFVLIEKEEEEKPQPKEAESEQKKELVDEKEFETIIDDFECLLNDQEEEILRKLEEREKLAELKRQEAAEARQREGLKAAGFKDEQVEKFLKWKK